MVVFDSMWHSTEMMAREICDSFIAGGISAKLIDVKASHISDIMTDLCDARYVAVGSPTLNSNMLPTVASFLTPPPAACRPRTTSASVWHLAPMVGPRLVPSRCTRSLRRLSSTCPCRLSPSSGSPARRTLPSCRPLSRRSSRMPAPSACRP